MDPIPAIPATLALRTHRRLQKHLDSIDRSRLPGPVHIVDRTGRTLAVVRPRIRPKPWVRGRPSARHVAMRSAQCAPGNSG